MVERTMPVREEVLEKKTVIDEIVEVLFDKLPQAIKETNPDLISYYISQLEGFLSQRNPNFYNEFLAFEVNIEGKKMKMIDLKNSPNPKHNAIYIRELIRYATAFVDRIKTVRQVLILDVSPLREFMLSLKTDEDEETESLVAEGGETG
jgi:hypothetical protein